MMRRSLLAGLAACAGFAAAPAFAEGSVKRKQGGASLEDAEEIRRLYSRYAWATDKGDNLTWPACFTPDGSFVAPGMAKITGREALIKMADANTASLKGSQTRHVFTNIRFDLDGDRGEGGCYFQYYVTHDRVSELKGVGFYLDQYRRLGGKWLFQSRAVALDNMP